MQFQLTDDQRLLVETTRRFLADTSSIAATRRLADTDDGFSRDWWQRGADLGWTSLLAPEALGGARADDTSLADLAEVAVERGRCVAPGPFATVNAAVDALSSAEHPSPELTALLDAAIAGRRIVTLAAEERGAGWPVTRLESATTLVADADGDGLVLNGAKVLVEAAGAQSLLVLAAGATGPVLVAVDADAPGVEIARRESVDLVRRFADVSFRDVAVADWAVVTSDRRAIERALDVATLLQLAETVGVLDRVLEFTKEWAFDRYTFGRQLASYQEIKHRFADMTLWLEASKATVVAAAKALGARAGDAGELVSVAASYVDDHGPELVQDCVQIHGGIGVTWEHDIHLYLRRATVNALTFGTTRDHRERLAALTLEGASR